MCSAASQALSMKMLGFMEQASWIRKMFEEGGRMKAEYGEEAVCDFSLGNPDLPPPERLQRSLESVAADTSPGIHAYMPNAGIPAVRAKIAAAVSRDHGVEVTADEVVMTCGAAGGLNIIFKALLNPGDEVIVPSPYFVEYGFYTNNHGGRLVPVRSKADFSLDLDALERAMTDRTKAVLLNSPNNPSGAIYSADELGALTALLARASRDLGRPVFLVSDEPYRRLVFSGESCPPLLRHYPESIMTTSFSKDLSIPGERIGYVAVHPCASAKAELLGAMILANRILGFVNAPALMQRVVAEALEARVDMAVYQRRRDSLAAIFTESGYDFVLPRGAFYFFPRSPLADDAAFVRMLQDERILAVPGSGFGVPGHFRVAFCVDSAVIARSREGFRRARARALGKG